MAVGKSKLNTQRQRRTDSAAYLPLSKQRITFFRDVIVKKRFPSLLKQQALMQELNAVAGNPHLSPKEQRIALIGVLQKAVYKAEKPSETLEILKLMKETVDEALRMQSESNYTLRRKP